jgi:plasmid stability protein
MADQLTIDVPHELAERLRAEAARNGRSVQLEAVEVLRQALKRPLTSAEKLAISQYYLSQSGGPHEPLTKEQIREGAE